MGNLQKGCVYAAHRGIPGSLQGHRDCRWWAEQSATLRPFVREGREILRPAIAKPLKRKRDESMLTIGQNQHPSHRLQRDIPVPEFREQRCLPYCDEI